MSNVAGSLRRRVGRRSFRVLGVVAGVGAVAAGIAVADSGNPPSAGYVPVSPATKVFSGNIATGKTVSAIAIGGVTTVPTNATAVRVSLAIKSTQAGILIVYPTGDPTAPDSQNVSYGAGTTNVTIDATVGTKDEINIHNAGSATATLAANATGYSTQLTATNVAPDGGTAGQVLTNNGDGTAWEPAGGPAYGDEALSTFFGLSTGGFHTLASETLPAGSYEITATGTAAETTNASTNIQCQVLSPAGAFVGRSITALNAGALNPAESFAMTGLLATTGGLVQFQCEDELNTTTAGVFAPSLDVVQVASASGAITPASAHGAQGSAAAALPWLHIH